MLDDTRFGRVASAVIDIIWSGILWLLCSLPLVTIGASSSALYYAVSKSVRHERGNLTKAYFKGFKDNFKDATLIWLVYLLILIPSVLSKVLIIFYAVPFVLTVTWMFAYISRFSERTIDYIKHVFYLCMKNIGKSILLALILLAVVVIGYLLPALIPLIPGITCLAMSYVTEPVFIEITSNMEGDNNEDKWYNE